MSRPSSPFLLVVPDEEEGSSTTRVEETEEDLADKKALDTVRLELDHITADRRAAELLVASAGDGRDDEADGHSTDSPVLSAVRRTAAALEALRAEEKQLLEQIRALDVDGSRVLMPESAARCIDTTAASRIPLSASITATDDECDAFFLKMTAAEQHAVASCVAEQVPDYDIQADPVVEQCFFCPITIAPLEQPHTLFGMTYSGEPLKRWVREKGKHPVLDRPATLHDIFPDTSTRDAMEQHVHREQQIVRLKRREMQRAIVRAKVLTMKSQSLGEQLRRQVESQLAEQLAERRMCERAAVQAASEERARRVQMSQLSLKLWQVKNAQQEAAAAAAAALEQARAETRAQSHISRLQAATAQLSALIAQEEGKRKELQMLAESITMKRRAAMESKMRWEPEKPNCSLCGIEFSLFLQRGRCHRCGANVCYTCSQNVGRKFEKKASSSPSTIVPICQKCFGTCHRELKLRSLMRMRNALSRDHPTTDALTQDSSSFLADGYPLFEVSLTGEGWLTGNGDAQLLAAGALRAAAGVADASPGGGIGKAMEVLADVVVPSVLAYAAAAAEYCKLLVSSPMPLVAARHANDRRDK
jgi:hypothetical protein